MTICSMSFFQESQLTNVPTTTPQQCNKGDRQRCQIERISDQRDMSVAGYKNAQNTLP